MSGAEERELLEWAAKAAGYTGRVEFSGLTDECFFAFGMSEQNPRGRSTWNPRHDDGDSRRLEVALRLWIRYRDNGTINVCWYDEQGFFSGYVTEPLGCDPCDTTRLAVLRAAAAIGKAMP